MTKQYKKLGCLDVDPKGGCAFEVRAETEDEVLRIASEHGRIVHKTSAMSSDMMAKVKASIKTIPVNL